MKKIFPKLLRVGCGICYQNDQEDWQVTEAAWQKTDDGFVMNTAGYKLEIGNTVNNWLHYVISDSDIYLRPSGIYASDGTNEQEISTLNLAACGQIDPEDNSRLIFADAYGAGIDLELQVLPDGYHQNIIFRNKPVVPSHFSLENTEIQVKTELSLDDYVKNQGVKIKTNDVEIDAIKGGSKTNKTRGDIRFVKSSEKNGKTVDKEKFRFADSKIFDSKSKNTQLSDVAQKHLQNNSTGESYLIETISHDYFQKANYPVTWDYQSKNGLFTEDEIWHAGDTWYVGNVTLDDGVTLNIEPGAVVKFGLFASLDASSGTSVGQRQAARLYRFHFM